VVNNQKHRFRGAILKIGCKDRDLFWENKFLSDGIVLKSRRITISMVYVKPLKIKNQRLP
jgi:hypothetical protein